jgi:hypothetical protein
MAMAVQQTTLGAIDPHADIMQRHPRCTAAELVELQRQFDCFDTDGSGECVPLNKSDKFEISCDLSVGHVLVVRCSFDSAVILSHLRVFFNV